MWKIWHRLFGWDYVLVHVFVNDKPHHDLILRVQRDFSGRRFVRAQYLGRDEIMFLKPNSRLLTQATAE